MSGLYRDIAGPGSVACTRQAVQDFGNQAGLSVEVIAADHQNKPDVGSNIARQWFDRDGVDVIVDVPTSSVALAVNGVVREKNKVFLNSTAATADLTGLGLHAEHGALDLRHLDAGALHRRRAW